MQFKLKGYHIFDESIKDKFEEIIKRNKERFNDRNSYELIVSFDLESMEEDKLKGIPNCIYNKITEIRKDENKVNKALGIQIHNLMEIMRENQIQVYSTRIEGDKLDGEYIKISMKKDKKEPVYHGRGKKKGRITVNCIAPNIINTRQRISEAANKRLSEIFYKFLELIKDRTLFSEVLGIEPTDDDTKLYRAFTDQYWELWFPTEEKTKYLINKFIKRLKKVLDERAKISAM